MTVSTNRRAARGVALHDPDPDLHQRKIILDMLGLISSAEIHMPPILEPTRHDMRSETINEAVQSIENQPTTGSAPKADAPMRDRSTVPEGLRNYKPDAPPPAEPKVRKIPQIDPEKCGTLSGRAAHSKRNRMLIESGLLGDPSCDKCRVFFTAYQRNRRNMKKVAA
jgi:hypothetical protein